MEDVLNIAPKVWWRGLCQGVGAQGSAGGLACFWDPRKICPIWWISSRYSLSVVACSLASGVLCLFTNVYAPVDPHGQALLWSHIRYVRSQAPHFPWIMARDFNAITSLEEKRSGVFKLDPSSQAFKDNIFLLDLTNIKPSNSVYT